MFHPGEKRMIPFALDLCELLPIDFEKNLYELFAVTEKEEILLVLRKIVSNIDDLLDRHM